MFQSSRHLKKCFLRSYSLNDPKCIWFLDLKVICREKRSSKIHHLKIITRLGYFLSIEINVWAAFAFETQRVREKTMGLLSFSGEEGNHLYVLSEGEAEVIKEDKPLGKVTSGKAFGELAILYNCTRTASVRGKQREYRSHSITAKEVLQVVISFNIYSALTHAKLWVLDRSVFQVIMMRSGLQRQEEIIRFLRSVPDLKNVEVGAWILKRGYFAIPSLAGWQVTKGGRCARGIRGAWLK